MRELATRFDLRAVALTLGAEGAALLIDDNLSRGKAPEIDVVDTVGAGDAFTAAVAIGMLRADPGEAILAHAVRLSAFVCTQSGATPKIPAELRMESPPNG